MVVTGFGQYAHSPGSNATLTGASQSCRSTALSLADKTTSVAVCSPFQPGSGLGDAHAAKRWLMEQSWVAAQEVYLTGFSHGATTVLLALHDDLNSKQPFAGAIAVAPWCLDQFGNSHTDLLILTGGRDQWTPAQRCRVMISVRPERVELVIYEDAYHSFDAPGVDRIYKGQRVAYDAQVAQDAMNQAREFFQGASGGASAPGRTTALRRSSAGGSKARSDRQ